MVDIFGLSINPKKKEQEREVEKSFIPPHSDDGALMIDSQMMSMDAVRTLHTLSFEADASSEADLINIYRTIALYPEIDLAIEEIINEMIINDQVNNPVSLNLDPIDSSILGENTKKKIAEEFDYVLSLLKFNTRGFYWARRWYIDSRLIFQKIVDKDNVKEGVQALRLIDPRRIRKIKEVKRIKTESGVEQFQVEDEYYLYYPEPFKYDKKFGGSYLVNHRGGTFPHSTSEQIIKIEPDSIVFCHSGQVDPTSGMVYGYLQKAIKPFNQLRFMEDAIVIYRLSRAPDRRVFYVDTGNMPAKASEKYVRGIQAQYKNKLTYDAKTGAIENDARVMSMQEDIWLPRREGSRGTQVDSLPGGQNLGEIEDLMYFKDKLWKALNVPTSRFEDDGGRLMLGLRSEITREELKFSKFVDRLRTQFNELFLDLLKTQVILKGIVTEEEWEEFVDDMQFDYIEDSHYQEAKDAELIERRIQMLDRLERYVGMYFSNNYVRRHILRQSEEEIKTIDDEIKEEEGDPQYMSDEEKMMMDQMGGREPEANTGQEQTIRPPQPKDPGQEKAEKEKEEEKKKEERKKKREKEREKAEEPNERT